MMFRSEEQSSINFGIFDLHSNKLRKTGTNDTFNLETFIMQLKLTTFHIRSEPDQETFLQKFDALDLFRALTELTNNITESKLENLILTEFLKKNEPRFRASFKNLKLFAPYARSSEARSLDTSTVRTKQPSSRFSSAGMSLYSHTPPTPIGTRSEFKLNSHFKMDLADKTCAAVDKRQQEYKLEANHAIKSLNASIEETLISIQELKETFKNFELHFFRDERDIIFLRTATERNLDRKFRKFVHDFQRSGYNMMREIGVSLVHAHEDCHQMRADLQLKSQLGSILSSVDFELFENKRIELLEELEEKNMHVSGLKAIAGRAAMLLAEEHSTQLDLEATSKRLIEKNIECIKGIGALEKEAIRVEETNNRDLKRIRNLYTQLAKFEAPSVMDYFEIKDILLNLEKEDRMLNRKINILSMKFRNIQKKCRSRKISIMY